MSCPICQSETDPKYRPFCSKRCADIDLAKWLSGTYRVPSQEIEDLDEALEEAARTDTESPGKPH